jgi:hypothetical protein
MQVFLEMPFHIAGGCIDGGPLTHLGRSDATP